MKLRLRLVALFALLVYTTTFGQADNELRNKANDLFQKEKYVDATQLYLQLLSLQPKDVELNYRYGICLLHQATNKSQAIRYLSYVVKENPNDIEPYFYLGKAFHLGYQFDLASKNYTVYLNKAGAKGRFVAEVKRNLEMSTNGKKLIANTGEIHVLERQEISFENFHRGYNLKEIGGSIIQAVDFQSKNDKKRGHKPVVHLLAGAELLYFSSYGDSDNLDIFVVRRLPNGNYGVAQPIKGEVNTQFDEDYPYMHPNGKDLYFSSKGHNSMGGYDIFKATFDPVNNQFIAVENIDFAVSSPDDDLLYLVDEQNTYAYFASNRQSADGRIHLYKVAVDRFPSQLVILKGSFDSDVNPEYKNLVIEVYDYQTNRRIGKYQTNETGDYVVVVPKGGKYVFKSNSIQFKGSFSQTIDIPHLDEVRPLRQYAKHFTKGTGTEVQFVNAFDEIITNPQEVIAEALRLRGELQPNERPKEEVVNLAQEPTTSLGKTAQHMGLPDWGMPTLFAHIDGLVGKYNLETEKQQNLRDIQNALIYQEYQKIEQIDDKFIVLSSQLVEASSNRESRDLEQQLDVLKSQRAENLRTIQNMESNRDAIFNLYRKTASKEQYSIEHMNTMVEQLFQAQKMGEEAFAAAIENREKEVKAIVKEPASVYKSILAEKTVIDNQIDQLENVLRSNKNRLKELNQQLTDKLLEEQQAKPKAKSTILSQMERIESEISEMEGNNVRVMNQLAGLSHIQDSLIQIVQAINRMEQFKGTPVSSKMLASAVQKFRNSPIEKGEITYKGQSKTKEQDLVPLKNEVPAELNSSVTTNELKPKNLASQTPIANAKSAEESFVSEGDKQMEKSEVTKLVVNEVSTNSEPTKRNTELTQASINSEHIKSTEIPSQKDDLESIEKPIVNDQLEQKSADKQSYRFVNNLSAWEKEILSEIDPAYIKRVEKLEVRTLNSGEQRVLIDLHRKYLEKLEDQQSAIQFGDRAPKTDREAELLATINEKLTQSIRVLNNLLSDDEIEEVGNESENKSNDNNGVIAQNKEEVKSTNLVVSTEIKEELNHIETLTTEEKQEEVKETKIVKEVAVTVPSSIQEENKVEPTIEGTSVQRSTKRSNQNSDVTPWFSIQKELDAVQAMRIEQENFLASSTNKKEKATIELMLNEIKKQEADLIFKKEEMIFESLAMETVLENLEGSLLDSKAKMLQEKSNALEKEKNLETKARLAQEKVQLAEEIIELQEADRKKNFILNTTKEGVSILNSDQLRSNVLYFEMKKRALEEEIVSLNTHSKKKKKEQEEQNRIVGVLEGKVDEYDSTIALLKKQLEAESKYAIPSIAHNNAPSYQQEYAILSSQEYEDFAAEKVRQMDLAYQVQIANVALDNKRDEVQQSWSALGSKSSDFKTGMVEIGELEKQRGEVYRKYLDQSKLVNLTLPNDATTRGHFENLASRGMNPIVHKELDQPLVDLKQKGIAFEKTMEVRSELNLDMPRGLVYRVQVGAFRNPIPAHLFKEFSPVTSEIIPHSSIKRYLAGYFSNELMAQSARDEIRELGYKDAFLIAYCDGNRVSMAEAKELEQSGRCKPQLIEQISFEINRSNVTRAKIVDRAQIDVTKINPGDYNKSEGAAAADALEGMQGLFFTVQVGVYNRPAAPDRFMGQHPLYTLRMPNGQIRYSVGAYTNLSDARTRERSLREVGLRDAYVVAYYQGERIPIFKAMELMDKGIIPALDGMQIKEDSTPILTIKEEVKIFDQQKRATWNVENRRVQLISRDSFTVIPVDFLNRFRSISYFYFDVQSGRVKSQSIDPSHYLVELEQLKKYFFVQEDVRKWNVDSRLHVFVVDVKSPRLNASFADLFLRHSNRIEIKELESGTQFIIFVDKGEQADFLDNALQEIGVTYKLVKEFTEQ